MHSFVSAQLKYLMMRCLTGIYWLFTAHAAHMSFHFCLFCFVRCLCHINQLRSIIIIIIIYAVESCVLG